MMSIVKKSVFEAKFYTGTVLRGYSFVNPYDGRGTIKEPATAFLILAYSPHIIKCTNPFDLFLDSLMLALDIEA
jgi:hypothetical protein